MNTRMIADRAPRPRNGAVSPGPALAPPACEYSHDGWLIGALFGVLVGGLGGLLLGAWLTAMALAPLLARPGTYP